MDGDRQWITDFGDDTTVVARDDSIVIAGESLGYDKLYLVGADLLYACRLDLKSRTTVLFDVLDLNKGQLWLSAPSVTATINLVN